MVNKNAIKLSPTTKDEIKEIVHSLPEGAISRDKIIILPSGVHTKNEYKRIVDVIRGGEAYIMEASVSRNTIYNVRKAIQNPQAEWNTNLPVGTKPIAKVNFGEVLVRDETGNKPTKNIALYLA